MNEGKVSLMIALAPNSLMAFLGKQYKKMQILGLLMMVMATVLFLLIETERKLMEIKS